jgi:hypothetical protein
VLAVGLCANGGSKVFLDVGHASLLAAGLRRWLEVPFWKTKTQGYQPNGLWIGLFNRIELKICKFLIFRDAKNAENGKIAANWNVSGTRKFTWRSG